MASVHSARIMPLHQERASMSGKLVFRSTAFWPWATIAFLIFLAVEGVLRLWGEESYPASEAAWLVLFAVGGWAIRYYREPFAAALRQLADMTDLARQGDVDAYVAGWVRRLFTLIAVGPAMSILSVMVVWFWTLYELGPPFDSAALNWLSYLFFVPMVVVGAWGSFIAAGAVVAVHETANRSLEAPFSVSRHPVMLEIESGWAAAGVSIALVYVLLLGAFWLGPFGLVEELVAWLFVFAVFPVFWFVAGSLQIHRMLLALKAQNLQRASGKVQKLSEALANDASPSTLQDLGVAMEIEAMVQAMPEWPSTVIGVAGFAFALAPLVVQVAVVSPG